jgi:hypothetical protein
MDCTLFIWRTLAEVQTPIFVPTVHFSNSASCKVLGYCQGLPRKGKNRKGGLKREQRARELQLTSTPGVGHIGQLNQLATGLEHTPFVQPI